MSLLPRRRHIASLVAGLLLALSLVAWVVWSWLAAEPGSAEDVFARIHIGMSLDEALPILRTHERVDGRYTRGVTKDGRSLDGIHFGLFEHKLPPPQQIEHCVLEVGDDYGRQLEITLGPGGVVTDKRLEPGVWEYRLEELSRKFHDRDQLIAHFYNRAFGKRPYLLLIPAWALVLMAAWRPRTSRRARTNPTRRQVT